MERTALQFRRGTGAPARTVYRLEIALLDDRGVPIAVGRGQHDGGPLTLEPNQDLSSLARDIAAHCGGCLARQEE
jgi:hypothetical protein